MTPGKPPSDKSSSGKPTPEKPGSDKSSSGKPKSSQVSSYSVKFGSTPEDQALLQAIQQAMAERSLSFEALCKLALKQLLASDPAALPMLALLEQQIMALQLQMIQLEQRHVVENEAEGSASLKEQIRNLSERVAQLEQQAVTSAPEPEPEIDPLLARMAPLLEEF